MINHFIFSAVLALQTQPELSPPLIPNHGQFAAPVQFCLPSKDQNIYFHEQGWTVVKTDGTEFPFYFTSFGNPLHWVGDQPHPTKVSYCSGAAEDWLLQLPTWNSLSAELQQGVVLRVSSETQRFKFYLEVAPGIRADDILLSFPDVDGVGIDEGGALTIHAAGHQLVDAAPVAWQTINQRRHMVEAHWKLAGERTARFEVGEYDPTLPLVIDPEMLLLCGFIGGSLEEEGRGIGVDQHGNLFVTGLTHSNDMPLQNAWQNTFGGGTQDVWVAKVTADHNIAFLTYLGGDSQDLPYDLSVDPAGNAYIAGGTASSNFPYLNGPGFGQQGVLDCFVTKLDSNGIPIYSGTFGGTAFDSLRGNYADADGFHYVIGRSFTADGSFPVVNGPSLTHSLGTSDVIVAKISQDGSTLLFSGFIGGGNIDYGRDIIADADGFVHACGWTNSNEVTFPLQTGPSLTYQGGEKDWGVGWQQYGEAFVCKLSPDGTQYSYIGYIGGAGADAAFSIALDEQGRAIVGGHTTSDENTFPVAVGPSLTYVGNHREDTNPFGDIWVGRVKADGSGMDFCGYVGGHGSDRAWRLARSPIDGAIYLAGVTFSDFREMPQSDHGPYPYSIGLGDGFLTRVQADGRWVDYTTFFASDGLEMVRDVAIGPDNSVHVVGWTQSQNYFPVVDNSWSFGGIQDAFVASVPPFYQLLRAGNYAINPITYQRPVPLRVNGSAGQDYRHEVWVESNKAFTISLDSPANLNETAAIYLIPREAGPADVFRVKYDGVTFGTAVFALPPFLSTDPELQTLVNGFGWAYLGIPHRPGPFQAPASLTWELKPGSYTIQAVIEDPAKPHGYSLSNAVIIHAK